MSVIEELQAAVSHVGNVVGPSVVRIGRGPGRGAGIVVGEGMVLTNAHNVRGTETTVTFADGRRSTGAASGVDVDADLAVLRVDTAGAPPVTWADDAPALGTPVFAVTTPADGETRVTFGTVSAVGRAFRGPRGRLIAGGVEHTAPLARGSSGSALVDADGRIVALSTHRLGDGFYLAVPADSEMRQRVEALQRGESPRRLHLGLAIYPSSAARRLRASVGLPERDGLLVRSVDGDGPAGRAGVRSGDLIVEAGGTSVAEPEDLFEVLAGLGAEDFLTLRLVRGADEIEVRVTSADGGTEGSA